MIHIGLFEGIGGFSLAASWVGWKTYVTCEIEKFPQRVLKYYWPDAYHHGDIHTLDYDTISNELARRYGKGWRKEPIILTGGFPCQPYSAAGKRKGKEDDRHLWPQMLRLIREVGPEYVVGENVYGLINWNGGLVFDEVQADLEAEGYEVIPVILPSASVNAPHRRDRVWFVAYSTNPGIKGLQRKRENRVSGLEASSDTNGLRGAQKHELQQSKLHKQFSERRIAPNTNDSGTREQLRANRYGEKKNKGRDRQPQPESWQDGGDVTNTKRIGSPREEHRQEKSGQHTKAYQRCGWQNFPTQSPVCDRDDGISNRLAGITFSKWRNESIKAMGNAIVPQVAFEIFKVIEQIESNN